MVWGSNLCPCPGLFVYLTHTMWRSYVDGASGFQSEGHWFEPRLRRVKFLWQKWPPVHSVSHEEPRGFSFTPFHPDFKPPRHPQFSILIPKFVTLAPFTSVNKGSHNHELENPRETHWEIANGRVLGMSPTSQYRYIDRWWALYILISVQAAYMYMYNNTQTTHNDYKLIQPLSSQRLNLPKLKFINRT